MFTMSYFDTIIHRSNCFRLIAACFYEPDKKLFLEEKVTDNLKDLFATLVPEEVERVQRLADAFEDSSEEQLKVDYAALFVGPFKLLAAPYGSVYLEKGRRVLGESTVAVQKCYDQAGLSLDIQEPADHIAIELEFLYYLSTREAEAYFCGRDADAQKLRVMQLQFMNYFMAWIPDFCERIERGALTDYYRLLAQCLASFFQYCKNEYLTEPIGS